MINKTFLTTADMNIAKAMPKSTSRVSPLTNKEIVVDIILGDEQNDQVEPFILANRMAHVS